MNFGNRSKSINPYQMASLGLLAGTLTLVLAMYLALQTPRLGMSFKVVERHGEQPSVWIDLKEHPAGKVEVVAISALGKTAVAISPFDLLEEPDILSFTEFNRFMQAQDAISQVLFHPVVELHLADGDRLEIATATADIGDLPVLFWLQAFYCLSAFLIAVAIWSFRKKRIEVLLLVLIGASYAVGGLAAAVYSTRELAMDGGIFLLLTVISHLGVYLFMGFLVTLLCVYPTLFYPHRFVLFAAIGASLISLYLNHMQWVDFYVMFLGFFTLLVLLLIKQWQASQSRPLERAAMQWFLLSIGLSTGSFFALVMLPASMGHQPLLGSQGSMLVFIWLMFIGITLGVARYRLFDLGRWWFFAVLWFIGGSMIVVLDLALLYIWSLPQTTALPLALIVIGWLYFPLRQWLWSKLARSDTGSESEYLPMIIEGFLGCHREQEMLESWPRILRRVFSPIKLTYHDENIQFATITENGVRLEVPGIKKWQKLRLEYAFQGTRLFSENDRKLAQSLSVLVQHSWQVTLARKQGMHQERERIKRELHDGLGAKLQAILHGSDVSGEILPIARDAWRELRDIVSALEGTERSLHEMAGIWRADFKRVVNALHLDLEWSVKLSSEIALPALTTLHLGRILSEGVQNAIRHAEPSGISVAIRQIGDRLEVLLANDGVTDTSDDWVMGRGMHNIRYRANELGGQAHWEVSQPGQVNLLVEIPVPA